MTAYRAEHAVQLVRKEIDGFTLVYHRPSGQTHFLASPMPEILDALEEAPARLEDVYETLARVFDMSGFGGGEGAGCARDQALNMLAEHLDALVALGLARAA